MIPKYDFKTPAKMSGEKFEIQTYIIQSNQSKNQKIIVQTLSWIIFFHGQVKFSSFSNKDPFF